MYLKKLELKNFKSHANSIIEFDQVTSIVGANSAGKSNIIRALKLLLHHGDWPASWIKYNEESASIKLELVDGTSVTRSRTKTSQSVTIFKDGKTTVFEGKKDAASFIEDALGIRKVTLDETTGPEDLNFVDVHDGPYLIGGRADTVQRKVAGIIGANKIDDARARLSKKQRKLDSELSSLSAEELELTPSIEKDKSFLNELENLFKVVEDNHTLWQDLTNKIQKLQEFINHFNSVSLDITTINVVNSITEIYENIDKTKGSFLHLNSQFIKAEDLISKINKLSTESLDLDIQLKTFHSEIENYQKIESLMEKINGLNSLGLSIEGLELEAYQLSEELEKAKIEKENRLRESGLCPVCERPYA